MPGLLVQNQICAPGGLIDRFLSVRAMLCIAFPYETRLNSEESSYGCWMRDFSEPQHLGSGGIALSENTGRAGGTLREDVSGTLSTPFEDSGRATRRRVNSTPSPSGRGPG